MKTITVIVVALLSVIGIFAIIKTHDFPATADIYQVVIANFIHGIQTSWEDNQITIDYLTSLAQETFNTMEEGYIRGSLCVIHFIINLFLEGDVPPPDVAEMALYRMYFRLICTAAILKISYVFIIILFKAFLPWFIRRYKIQLFKLPVSVPPSC